MPRPVRTSVLLAALLGAVGTASPAAAVTRRECRRRCAVAIERCVEYRTAPLLQSDVGSHGLRRKTRILRRRCTKTAERRCRRRGQEACETPLYCACRE
jgi:hypothetical protein